LNDLCSSQHPLFGFYKPTLRELLFFIDDTDRPVTNHTLSAVRDWAESSRWVEPLPLEQDCGAGALSAFALGFKTTTK